MALLRPRHQRPPASIRIRSQSVLRCPMNGHQVSFCRGLCTPSSCGVGLCGRLAPHALVGRTQVAVAEYERRRLQACRPGPPA
jgi:hypothetical protein